MKITHNTDDTLILDHTPWALAIGLSCLILLFMGIGLLPIGTGMGGGFIWWVFSFMFIVVGGGMWLMALELFARRLQFVFDRREDRITIRHRSLFSRHETNHRLSRLIEARIEQGMSDKGQAMARPVLILRSTRGGKEIEQTTPLHSYFTSGSGPENMATAINSWWQRDTSKSMLPPSRA